MTVKLSSSTGQEGECRNMDAEFIEAITRRISRSACTDTLGRVSAEASSSVGQNREKEEESTKVVALHLRTE